MPKHPAIANAAFGLICLAATAGAKEAESADPNARWESAIAGFEKADKAAAPPKDSFLFVGSSSIRMWKLEESFPGLGAINRGFGGSEIENSTHFADRIIVAHRPHTVLLYAGDNDVAKGKSAGRVTADFKAFVAKVKASLPGTHIAFIAIKPSIKRWTLWPTMQQANEAIAALCAEDDALTYLDIAKVTLGEDGKPRADLFLEDGLHLNTKGYAAWCEVIDPYLAARKKQLATATK